MCGAGGERVASGMATTSVSPIVTPPREASPRDISRLREVMVVTAAATAFAVLAVAVRLGWGPLLSTDTAVARDLNALVAPRPALVRTLTAVTTLGSAGVLVWIVVLAVILLLTRRRFLLAAYLAVSTSGALILDPTLKALIGRLRPVVEHPVAVGGGSSFPSGHSLDSLICYGALLLVFLPAFPRRRRWIPVAAAGTVIVLIGLTRILLGVHFVSDVIGAWSVGTAWLGLTVFAFELHRTQSRPPRSAAAGRRPRAGGRRGRRAGRARPASCDRRTRTGAGRGDARDRLGSRRRCCRGPGRARHPRRPQPARRRVHPPRARVAPDVDPGCSQRLLEPGRQHPRDPGRRPRRRGGGGRPHPTLAARGVPRRV